MWADAAEHYALMKQFRATGELRNAEYRFRRKNGEIGVGLLSLELIELDGQPCAISQTIDITCRKRAEVGLLVANDALAKAERHHRQLFNSVSDTLIVFKLEPGGLSSQVVDVNDNACRFLGYTRDEFLRLRVKDIDPPENHSNAPAIAQRLFSEGHLVIEGALLAKDGRRLPVEINTHIFDLDGSATMISCVRDIADRKEAERQYRQIFDGALEGIFRTSIAGKCLAANPALAGMLGYPTSEEAVSALTDTGSQVWLDPEDRARITKIIAEKGSARGFVCQFKRRDGTPLWISMNARQVCGSDGTPVYYDGFVEDITERKRVECEKSKLEEQFRQSQKLESVGRLAGGVAHDFNNLLTVINGYSDLLLKQLRSSDPLITYASEIKKAGEHAAGLVKQLLAFSNKQVIRPRILDLNAAIKDSGSMLQRLLGDDIHLETRLADTLGNIMADPDQIHQVIVNLTVNARDAMVDGGMLSITTRNVNLSEGKETRHPDAGPGRYVLMTVSDTGHGMDETIREQIFEPFFTTKEPGTGTGLGLSTVYGIIRHGGGWIDVTSEVGMGTSFKIYFPRTDDVASEVEGPGLPAEGSLATILVVEDQDAVRSFVAATLQRYGFQVIAAFDASDAFAVAGRHLGRIDLLLTDVVMPGMNGKLLSDRMKKLRPNLRVLFTSGYTADVIGRRGVLDRDVAYIAKPFSADALVKKIREVLEAPLGNELP